MVGESGAGKTVAARAAIAGLDQTRHTLVYIANPTTGARGVCHHIVTSLGGVPRFQNAALFPQAADALAAENTERGRQPVLAIDEAHLLDHDALDLVRMLTNAEMDSTSPLACVLIGQPTLKRKMKLGILVALDQRIAVRYTMAGLTAAETASYIGHHLKLAGRADPLFSDDAITLIHDTSRGYPRTINNVAVHALLAAFADGKPSSTNPAPAPPSPNSPRQTDHHTDNPNTKAPPAHASGAPSPSEHIIKIYDGGIITVNVGEHQVPTGASPGESTIDPWTDRWGLYVALFVDPLVCVAIKVWANPRPASPGVA